VIALDRDDVRAIFGPLHELCVADLARRTPVPDWRVRAWGRHRGLVGERGPMAQAVRIAYHREHPC
jgi:hypothetical protein